MNPDERLARSLQAEEFMEADEDGGRTEPDPAPAPAAPIVPALAPASFSPHTHMHTHSRPVHSHSPTQQQPVTTRAAGYGPYAQQGPASYVQRPQAQHTHSHGAPYGQAPQGHSHGMLQLPHNHSHSPHSYQPQPHRQPLSHSHAPSSYTQPVSGFSGHSHAPAGSGTHSTHSHAQRPHAHTHGQQVVHSHGQPGQWYVRAPQGHSPGESRQGEAMLRSQQVRHALPSDHICMHHNSLGTLLSRVFRGGGPQPPFRVIAHRQIDTERIDDNSCMFTLEDVSKLPEENTSCTVCLELFKNGEDLRTLPCLHFFHPSCVDRWLREHAKCPTCRADIQEMDKKAAELLSSSGQ